jgi:hypothetical protein
MINDIQMLGSICQTADMARDSLNHVLEKAADTKLHNQLQKQIAEYESIYKSGEEMLYAKGKKPQKTGAPLKAYSHMISTVKTLTSDNATSKIAEMVIQGSTMGITEMTRQLNDYHGEDKDVRSLAKKHIQTEQTNIDEVKKFL